MSPQVLSPEQVARALVDLDGWSGSPEKLERSIEFGGFLTAVEFIDRLAPRCEELNHHPDLGLHWRRVDIELATHSAGGVTEFDVTLARVIDEIARDLPQA